MMVLSRTEMNIVAMATVVFASITYKVVDRALGMIPIVNKIVPAIADPNGCPSTFGYIVHVIVFALAVKYVLPRM